MEVILHANQSGVDGEYNERIYQRTGETLWSYIRRFSEMRNSIPNISEVEIISFMNGVQNSDLRGKLNHKPPTRIGEMLQTAEQYADAEEIELRHKEDAA